VTPGRYDFAGTATCQNVAVIELLPGAVYWLSKFSVGGNIPQEDYLGSIVDFPQVTVKRQSRPEAVYRFPITIDKYINNADCGAFVINDRREDNLTVSLSGSCRQLASMVGIATLSLTFSINVFEINEQGFAARFRSNQV
jgi:hypothetical protein